jgi:hypothetical protein
MIYAEESLQFEAPYVSGVTGLVGIVAVQIIDNQGAIALAPTTLGIIESPAGSGVYAATLLAPAAFGQYTIIWSFDGTFNADTNAIDELIVYQAGSDPTLPPLPAPAGSDSLLDGPCSAWTTEEKVLDCCSAQLASSDTSTLVEAISAASAVLYRLSGRRYAGSCEKTVRPCGNSGCGFQVLSRGHIVWPDEGRAWSGYNWSWPGYGGCGCQPMDRVLLYYPARAIIQVKIDGVPVLAPNNWRLDRNRFLTRIADVDGNRQFWPSCQRMDLPDSELGTFSVRYSFGEDPPWDGMAAASQLACEIFKGCNGEECALPAGVTRIARQGIVIDKMETLGWVSGKFRGTEGYRTGLSMVDAFLNSVNPSALMRRPVIVTPGKRQFPEQLG